MFTSLPIAWFALYDHEMPKKDLMENPALYYRGVGQSNKLFDRITFWRFIMQAAAWSLFMVVLVANSFETGSINPEGQTGSFWIGGMIIYCYVVI